MSSLLGKIRPGGYVFSFVSFGVLPSTPSYDFILALSIVEIKYICPKEGPKQLRFKISRDTKRDQKILRDCSVTLISIGLIKEVAVSVINQLAFKYPCLYSCFLVE